MVLLCACVIADVCGGVIGWLTAMFIDWLVACVVVGVCVCGGCVYVGRCVCVSVYMFAFV